MKNDSGLEGEGQRGSTVNRDSAVLRCRESVSPAVGTR